jgi:hypothetical protein
MPGGARRIDDECRLLRPHLGDLRLQPRQVGIAAGGAQLLVGDELGVAEGEQRRVVDHHDAAQRRQPLRERQDAVDVLLVLGDEQHRAAVAHLILDLLGRCGGVDAVDDGPERLSGEIAHQPLLAGVGHDGDALAGLQPGDRERLRRACHQTGVPHPATLAVEPERLGAERDPVRLAARPLQQQRGRRGAAQVVGGAQLWCGFAHRFGALSLVPVPIRPCIRYYACRRPRRQGPRRSAGRSQPLPPSCPGRGRPRAS